MPGHELALDPLGQKLILAQLDGVLARSHTVRRERAIVAYHAKRLLIQQNPCPWGRVVDLQRRTPALAAALNSRRTSEPF